MQHQHVDMSGQPEYFIAIDGTVDDLNFSALNLVGSNQAVPAQQQQQALRQVPQQTFGKNPFVGGSAMLQMSQGSHCSDDDDHEADITAPPSAGVQPAHHTGDEVQPFINHPQGGGNAMAAAAFAVQNSMSGVQLPQYMSVMSEDKSRLLRIPSHLIEPTMGSTRYLSEPNKKAVNMNAFKFHLCTEHRKETGGCPYKNECFFIHSKHTLDDSLTSQIEESPVHVCLDVKSYAECPYPTHKYDDEGKGSTNIAVTDSMSGQTIQIEAGCVYVTKGSLSALTSASRQHASQMTQKGPNSGGSAVPIKLPPHSMGSPHLQPHQNQQQALSPRHTLCTHYVRGWCARGAECLYLHRIKINGRFIASRVSEDEWLPPATAAAPGGGLLELPKQQPLQQQQQQQLQQVLVLPPQEAFQKQLLAHHHHQHNMLHQSHHHHHHQALPQPVVAPMMMPPQQQPLFAVPPQQQQPQVFAINTPSGIQYVQVQPDPQAGQQQPFQQQSYGFVQQPQNMQPYFALPNQPGAGVGRGQQQPQFQGYQQQPLFSVNPQALHHPQSASPQILFHNGVAYMAGPS